MSKEKLNQLVSSYQELAGDKSKMFAQILGHKEVKSMSEYVRRRFNYNYIAYVDFDSIVNEALLKSLNKYSLGCGHFANYYMTWLSSTLTREAIKSQPGIRLPEELAKKNFQISNEARELMIQGTAKEEIKEIYGLNESKYNRLVHFFKEVPRFLEDLNEDVVEDKDICIDVTRILDQVPLNYRKPIIFYFGLFGKTRQTPAQIKNYYKVDIEEVLEYLRNAKEIKEILEDYNE